MAAPVVKLKVQPVPKTYVRIALAGDVMRNLMLDRPDDGLIRNIQQGVSEGVIGSIICTGINTKGEGKTRLTLRFDDLHDDAKIVIDTSDGKSTIEALDTSMAVILLQAVSTLRRRGLSPRFHFEWTQRAKANPAILNEALYRLRLSDEAPPPLVNDPPPAPATASPVDDYLPPYSSPAPSPPQKTYTQPTHTAAEAAQLRRWYREYLAKNPPKPAPTQTFQTVAKVTPTKDDGVHLIYEEARTKK